MGFTEIHRRQLQTPEMMAAAMSQWEDVRKLWVSELEVAYPEPEERQLFGGDEFMPVLERLEYCEVNGAATLNDSIVRLDELYLKYSWSLATGKHFWKLQYLDWSAEGSPQLYVFIVSQGEEQYGIDGAQFRTKLDLFFRLKGFSRTPEAGIRYALGLRPQV